MGPLTSVVTMQGDKDPVEVEVGVDGCRNNGSNAVEVTFPSPAPTSRMDRAVQSTAQPEAVNNERTLA